MGHLSAAAIVFALAATAALVLSACGSGGGDELLPGSTASQITANLDQVERLVGEGECIGAENSAAEIATQVQQLQGVDRKLKAALAEGAARLTEEVEVDCQQAEEEGLGEEEPGLEAAEEAEAAKPKHEKPAKPPKEEKEGPGEEAEGPTLPPQANGKGEENGQGEGPPVEPPAETGPPSGGVGPGVPAEGE